jgi:hypothetical protein
LQRYQLFFSKPGKLFKNPMIGAGMLFMKTCEYAFGGAGYLLSGKTEKKPTEEAAEYEHA